MNVCLMIEFVLFSGICEFLMMKLYSFAVVSTLSRSFACRVAFVGVL